ncbi:MAG TPA: FHA domain-containing protein [Steroidobacteraceae bacterium]|nr:FHA domain-containing protein [Steroidobacteraceae bacterium]
MYPQFFGFDKLPFRLRPDPEFLYSGREYLHARAGVLAALRGSARVVLFTGQPGVGKTLLLDDVLRETGGQFAPCRINQPHISATELLQAVVMQLSTAAVETDANHPRLFAELATALNAGGSREAPPLLSIDDAQLLTAATLLTLGDILARAPRLKVLLVARNDAEQRSAALAARMAVTQPPRQVALAPLGAESTKAYIEHRLNVAGGGGKELFTPDAYNMIFQHTGGAARLVNVLCDAALHAACLRASGHVSSAEILLATQDSRWPDALARESARPSDATHEPGEARAKDAAHAGSGDRGTSPDGIAQLFVSHNKEHLSTWPLKTGRMSIGRASDNELRLDAPYISRHHCQIVTAGNTSTVEDLGSVNGIAVNGKLVKRRVLQNDDQIMLGEHVLTYVVN